MEIDVGWTKKGKQKNCIRILSKWIKGKKWKINHLKGIKIALGENENLFFFLSQFIVKTEEWK